MKESAAAIQAKLPGYIRQVHISADKKRITLTLKQPVRLRQFVSNKGVGVDLIATGKPAKEEAKPAAEKPSTHTESAESASAESAPESLGEVTAEAKPEKPAAPAPEKASARAKQAAKEKPAKDASKEKAKDKTKDKAKAKSKDKPKTGGKEKPAKKFVSPAAPVAAVAAKPLKPEPVKEAVEVAAQPVAPASQDAMLSTRNTTEAPPSGGDAMLSTKKPASAAEGDKGAALLSTKTATADKPAEKPPEKPAEPTPEKAAEKPPEKPATVLPATAAAKAAIPFVVGTHVTKTETLIDFPWAERTAAAAFRRGKDIWIVFSREANVNADNLRSVMPKQVANVTQYALPGATVLRLTTDGSLNPRAELQTGGYGWRITLSTEPSIPSLEVLVSAEEVEGMMRLVLSAYDVAPEVAFFDPASGEKLLVVPAYEAGRGISMAKNFTELSLLPSAQVIAVVARRGDLTVGASRAGLILGAPHRLAVSDNLPLVAGTTPTVSGEAAGVMIPYGQWFVTTDKFHDTLVARQAVIAQATESGRAAALMDVAHLYLAYGMCPEAIGVLEIVANYDPAYYKSNKLALLTGACHAYQGHMEEASAALAAPELENMEEAILWREVVALSAALPTVAENVQQNATPNPPNAGAPNDAVANTPKAADATPDTPRVAPAVVPPAPVERPVFHFLKYNKQYIRFYPPTFRQRLAVLAADAYLKDGEEEKALAVFDTLARDGILDPVKQEADYYLGAVAEKKKEYTQAEEIYDRLASEGKENLPVSVRARVASIMLNYRQGKIKGEDAVELIESARLSWRGDAVEREMLDQLVGIYADLKRYDDVLRTKKTILDVFPTSPDTLKLTGEMADLFQRIFLDGLADEMDPLRALALFYEFRDLTPLGENGNKIIQKLADRLAAFDLLDRASQLLEHQIKYRIAAEERSHVGARLALLYLLNQKPQEALSVLDITNFGGNDPKLQQQRQEMTAQALMKLGKNEEALAVIFQDTSRPGALLRLDILWRMQDWPNIASHAEDLLNARPNLTDPLSPEETEILLKLALAYTFESDYNQLRYLRDYYMNLVPDNGYKKVFEYITNDTTPLDPEDFNTVAQQISHTESFLDSFREKIKAGKLSEAVP